MKIIKILTIYLFIFQAIVCIKSQETKNMTKVSYGNFTLDQFFNVQSPTLPDNYSRSDLKSKGALFISISHDISGCVRSGAALGANKITSDVVENNQRVGTLNRNLYTLAIESDIIYFKRQKVQLYSVLGFGYSLGNDEYFLNTGKSDKGFIGFMSFQISPIAIRVGDKLALFTELGFGYKGIASFGFLYRF